MRVFTTLFFILLTMASYARQISLNQAESVAKEFFSTNFPGKHNATASHALPKATNQSADQPYYIFNSADNKGFVIVAGDDRAQKILGFTDRGCFDLDKMPPQLVELLNRYIEQMKSVPGTAQAHSSWKTSTLNSISDGGIVLETANWGQGDPYNSLCPTVEGVKVPTGCVATAMAIVMKYHNWPDNYNWDAMPVQDINANNSSEIATLMRDAGEAVVMRYTPYESSAYMNFVGHRFQQCFKYSPECQFISAKNFSDDVWKSMLKSDLQAGNPVIYNGTGSGNHAFIIDGYDNNDLYHINWGWDGAYNGMFALNALTPGPDYFNDNATMVINIAPDKTGKEYSKIFCDYGYFWATGQLAPGAHFSVDAPAQNQTFDFTCLGLSYPCDANGQIGLLLFDKDGNVKEVIKTMTFTEVHDDFGLGLWGSGLNFFDIAISSQIETGDYLTLASRKSSSDAWLEVLSTIEAPVRKTVAKIKKDVGTIKIVNNTQYQLKIYKDRWIDISPEDASIEFIKAGTFRFNVFDDSGSAPANITIKVEGKGLYGDTNIFYDGHAIFDVYGDEYTLTVEVTTPDIEKTVNLTTPGKLSEALKDTELSQIASLTITGTINAEDLWFIRDNIKSIKALDISEASIAPCEATDPVESFQISGPEHPADALPAYAFTGLSNLELLSLPKNLKHIESNSMMNLSISRIELPASLQTIGLNVFFDCINLKTVICKMNQAVSINECVFTNTQCPSSGVLYVPTGTIESYNSTSVWQDFAQIIENENPPLDNDVVTYEGLKYRIHGKALYLFGYEQAQLPMEVVIPDAIPANGYDCKVLGIDDSAMQNAEMHSFTMSNTITTIGSSIFTGSTVVKVHMSDNIKYLPFNCINGDYIEELHLPENAESICNSIYCERLKKLHLPKNLKSEIGYLGSVGMGFKNLEEITIDPENEEWSVHDGILYWKGLSHLIQVPNNKEGELIIPNATTNINIIEFCDNITNIQFGDNVKSLNNSTIRGCNNLKHISFNNNIIFSGNSVISDLPSLESITMQNFIWSYDNCFANLGSLKYVYLLNENPVDFSKTFYSEVNEAHDYFSSSLNPQALVPENSKIYVPGGVKTNSQYEEMWKYQIDRINGKIKIQPLIPGLVIDGVTINGTFNTGNSEGIYNYDVTTQPNPVVDVAYTLHERQPMTTYYDEQFNSSIPDIDIPSGINDIMAEDNTQNDIHNLQGILIKRDATQADIDNLPTGIYIINGNKVTIMK